LLLPLRAGSALDQSANVEARPVPHLRVLGTPIPKRLFHPAPLIINQSQNVEPPESE
jgi:hypothetical protein